MSLGGELPERGGSTEAAEARAAKAKVATFERSFGRLGAGAAGRQSGVIVTSPWDPRTFELCRATHLCTEGAPFAAFVVLVVTGPLGGLS